MDDNTKTVNQNANVPSNVPVNPVTSQNQPQDQGVGSVHKEQGPVRAVIEKSDVELKIDKELEDMGVETKSDDINLTSEHTQAGLQYAGSSIPVSTAPSSSVTLPQTPMQIKTNIKKTKPTDSLRGLLLEILKNIQRIVLKEQKV